MSSRYPPSSGFNSRDRSPQRFGDRRPPAGPRGSDDANSAPLGREPPRGPKALIDHPRGAPFGGRGRGFPGRGEFRDRDRDPRDRARERDRDFRDPRDGPPPFRRDIDRDWPRRERDFDPRDSRIGFGRGRSRSPPPPPRDFRDMREPVGRDSDIVRMRRGSRDSLVSVSSNAPDGPALGPNHLPRGGPMRGRGRGDWEAGRGRGRAQYLDDRDSFRRRSRSRDGRREWERDRERDRDRDRGEVRDRVVDRERERERGDRERIIDRDRERDIDRRDRERERDIVDRRDRFERRDDLDRPRDRDERDRPAEAWKRDQPPGRADTRTPSGAPLGSMGPVPAASDRLDHPIVEPPRKPSMAEARRDSIRPDLAASRPDSVKELPLLPIQRSPPPAAPQVPAFGSVTAPIPDLSADKVAVDTTSAEVAPIVAEKECNQPPSRAPVQPPTGPKAERVSVQPSPEQRFRREERRDEGLEPSEKDSFIPRAPKTHASPSLHARKQTPELSPPTAPAAMIGKEIGTPHGEAPFTGRTSSRVTSPELNKGRTPSIGATSPGLHIPTGPRALQQRPTPTRGPPKGKPQWARPGYSWHPAGPGAVPLPKRDSIDGKERSLSISEEPKREPPAPVDEHGTELEAGEILPDKEVESDARRSPETFKSDAVRHVTPPPVPQADVKSETKVTPDKPAIQEDTLIPDFGRSSDEDEEENEVFTQEYLEERKQIFEKDMKALRAEMPPPPLEDPHIVSLLMQIQLLGVLANEQAAGEAALPPVPPVEVKTAEEAVEPAPIVVKQDAEIETPGTSPKLALDLPPVDSISIKDLPFLQSGPPTPISDLDVYQENAAIHARMKDVFSQELIKQRKEIARKNAELREVYLSYYKPWRLHVWELGRAKARASSTPRAATPQAPPAAPTPPVAEGRRYKGNSELDFQMALRASEISAQEELERRRVKKATAQPDLAREAVIPDMLEPKEAKAQVYKDTNNTVDPAKAKDVFGFLPPPNDFTPEEHEIFTEAFMAYPKKWGKIAEALPGRDFQQCIMHYYLTKEEIKYKAKLNKRWSRRGRARRSARPKSNALMKDLGVVKPDYDGEEEPAPVTDTGRPRRAAAPTFGDSSAADTDTNGRRGAGKDGEPGEKPRRGGRTGTGTRGNRRGKAAQQQQQQQPQQQQQQIQTLPQPSTQVSKAPHPGDPEQPMQTVLVPAVTAPVVPPPKTEPPETFMAGVSEPVRIKETIEREITEAPRAKAGRGRQREGMYVFESAEQETLGSRQAEGGYGSLQPTSYWSVPEQRDFPQLLAHFGRDFEGISNFMKTKTTVMVKNYFQRRVDSGQKDFEDIVADAEAKKARGERTGPLPVPNFASKRRYEATPSSIMPRPLAPHTDGVTEEEGRTAKTKHTATPSQLAPLHARPPPEKERSVSRYPPLAQASNVPMSAAPMLGEDPSRAIRSQVGLPPRLQGPRLGYFTEERREAPAMVAHANVRPEVPLSARQTPVPVSEMPRMEPLHAQSFRSSMDMHGSPLLAAQGSIPPQQAYMQQQQQQQHAFMPSATHSRQSSLTKPPGSPAQLQRQEEVSPIRRDSISQRPFYPLPGQHAGLSQPPILSPPKEPPRPSSTPLEPEAPRHVPAKRSNIMSILNDEPEEPQPRKRFASDQASSNAGKPGSPSRPIYSGHSLPQQALSRPDETRQPLYAAHSQYLPPSRAYSDYQAYSTMPGGSPAPANNDWMARFDPRGQQQQQQPAPPQPSQPSNRPATTLAQPSYSPYTSGQSLPPPSLPNLTAPSSAPTPSPAPTQRPSYGSVYAQSPSQTAPSGTFRPAVGSPPSRHNSIAYGSRQGPPTPVQSQTSLLGLATRPPASTAPYTSSVQTTTAPPSHMSAHASGHQTYQQHVQTMVNGAHQQQPHRSSLGLSAGYGHNTPPPQAQASRATGLPGPASATMGRSYTPPAILQPNPTGYPGGPSGMHPLQARPSGPGSLAESLSSAHNPGHPGHQRGYSQGSNAGHPGGMAPQHPPR